MTKPTITNEEPTPTPELDVKDLRIKELEDQVRALEKFLNAVVAQRNEALNQAAMKG